MRMTPSALSFLLICTLMATVRGQQSIVSTNTITSGSKFTVTCDASKAATPGIFSVQQLSIYRNLTSPPNSYSTVAQYRSLSPPGLNKNFTNIPDQRNWTFTFSGDNNGASGNAASMRIVWDVNDASCNDAGVYRCQIDYNLNTGLTTTVFAPDQNVTATTGLSSFALTVDPNKYDYAVDDNVTFTCMAVGPATGVTFMWEFWVKDQYDMDQSLSLPANSEIVPKPPTLQTGNTGCVQYNWASMLRIQVPDKYDQQTYKCIVTYLQQQQSGNWTIGTTGGVKPETAEITTGGTSPDVGMIVGIIIGCLVAIAIVVGIIFFLRYRKRSQENRSGNKDEHDAANDANLHAPPPVFYPSSKQSKGSKDEKDAKIPTGTTNEALDTSYDSRDSVSKGPPRYANAESDAQGPPRYEKEVKRGRQNRGYDEEEREKNERNTSQGRRQPREREERRHKSRDYDDDEPPRRRYYNADDGTDSRIEMGDPNLGTSI